MRKHKLVYKIIHLHPKDLRPKNTIWSIENNLDRMDDIWKEYQKDSSVKKKHLINDPKLYSPRAMWTNLNRTRTEQGDCNYLLHKWKINNSPHCDYGHTKTIGHIEREIPQTRLKRGIEGFRKGDDEAMWWRSKTHVSL